MWWHNYVFTAVVQLHCYLEVRLPRRSLLMSVGDETFFSSSSPCHIDVKRNLLPSRCSAI